MNPFSPEHILEAQRASRETLVGLTTKVFDGFERLLDLNLQTMKGALSGTRGGLQKALSVKSAQELVALQIELLKPVADNALTYRRQFFDIASTTRAELDKVAEFHYEANKRGVQRLIESAVSAGPAGSGAAVAAWQSAIDAAHTLYEAVQATAEQAVQVAERAADTAAVAASKTVKTVKQQTAQATTQ